eukprot:gene13527-19395_t
MAAMKYVHAAGFVFVALAVLASSPLATQATGDVDSKLIEPAEGDSWYSDDVAGASREDQERNLFHIINIAPPPSYDYFEPPPDGCTISVLKVDSWCSTSRGSYGPVDVIECGKFCLEEKGSLPSFCFDYNPKLKHCECAATTDIPQASIGYTAYTYDCAPPAPDAPVMPPPGVYPPSPSYPSPPYPPSPPPPSLSPPPSPSPPKASPPSLPLSPPLKPGSPPPSPPRQEPAVAKQLEPPSLPPPRKAVIVGPGGVVVDCPEWRDGCE